ncbi:ABC transporter substrate-binding protein [Lacticaseibacillus nasuensis]|uniref:ABC transporter substrate-binding protein n=1 Tax=Lacticaseibacillus nasuensis TaxID=944671 RepID=UPI002247EB5F|nr:ABC transporter substrate-binding protein [Lacticaseibacillus nasuensis]MCX2456322.1 ABC transporter substrate-binding protein [Lacticaseibacillus nasuensis]
MHKRIWKIASGAMLLTASMLTLAACGNSSANSSKSSTKGKTLQVWTFTTDMKKIINNYYKPMHKNLDYKIKITVVPFENFQTKLDPVLGTKNGPDLIALDASFVKKYVDSGKMADLSQVGIKSASANTTNYVKQVGQDAKGHQVALSWQATPGAYYYRASLAKKYLGVTTPEQMQAKVSTAADFTKTAQEVNQKSNGKIFMTSSICDLFEPMIGARKTPWVVNNKLKIDKSMLDLMDMSKQFVSGKLTQDTTEQSSEYFSGMSSNNIMGYSLPSWGLFYWLQPNAKSSKTGNNTAGDWRVVKGPWSYSWGGTYLGAVKNSPMEHEAAKIAKWVATNPKFQTKWAKDQNDFVSNQSVVKKITPQFTSKFLGGQNQYKQFAESAKDIDGNLLTKYDQTIQKAFVDNALTPYSQGKISKAAALKAFKDTVQNAFPDITVK